MIILLPAATLVKVMRKRATTLDLEFYYAVLFMYTLLDSSSLVLFSNITTVRNNHACIRDE